MCRIRESNFIQPLTRNDDKVLATPKIAYVKISEVVIFFSFSSVSYVYHKIW